MIGLIITNTSNNPDITNSNSNWNPNDTNTWDTYYKNNCPPNKLYKLTDYQNHLKNITLVNTSKNPKQSFTINDLLNEIDGELVKASVNIPNNFFNHLPLNPAISIKIDGNNALLSNFTISMSKYNEQKAMNIEIITTDVGISYHLEPSDLNFKFIVKNDNKPVLININDLDLRIPEETVAMTDITKGTNTEVINGIDSDIS
ncbi:hypothetical protein [Spiroplasma endosymbiont of Nebria brevicollis]|uniref:hypothetical protein n=1 Tax=Spiroplasma endosymbiont of Nebria brevicollis TaxID=3066284 RepID=UPI00313E1A22